MTTQKMLRQIEAKRREVRGHERLCRGVVAGTAVSFSLLLLGIAWGVVGLALGLDISACWLLLPFGIVGGVVFPMWRYDLGRQTVSRTTQSYGGSSCTYALYDPRSELEELEERYYASISGA